jgi:S-adenosylmethionine hydrolase
LDSAVADPRPITFLSDYGYDDEFAGVCRAVIAQIAPGAPVIDLTHGIGRQGIRHGALALANSLSFCPPGVHLAVVDPGVGTERRAVAVRPGSAGSAADDRLLVGPDNGLLGPALQRLGGATEAVDLARSPFRLEPVSATFHGRDLFAPVAAHLALGATLGEAGESIEPASLAKLELPQPRIEADRVVAHALHADRFGNVALDLGPEDLGDGPLAPGARLEVRAPDGRFEATWARTFANVERGDLLLYEDSTRTLALSVNGGSAAGLLDLDPDDEVELRPL